MYNSHDINAVLLAYRADPRTVAANLTALGSMVRMLIVVDNSSSTDTSRWQALASDQRVVLPIMNECNKGVAAGFNAGITLALQSGASHVLLLDEDSAPEPGMVERLLNVSVQLSTECALAAVGPDFTDATTGAKATFPDFRAARVERGRCMDGDTIIPSTTLMSSGMLIHRSAFTEIGMFEEGLFVDYVDTEWCLRARDLGWKCFGVCGAHMEHAFGNRSMSLPWPWRGVVAERDPTRTYYIYRNALRLLARPGFPVLWKIVELRRLILLLCLYVLRSGSRRQHLRMAALGIRDVLQGRTGAMAQDTEASPPPENKSDAGRDKPGPTSSPVGPGLSRPTILALCRYGDAGASSRVRMLQYLPHLERLGLHVRALPLLPDSYVEDLYAGRRVNVIGVAGAYVRRARELLQQNREVVLWVEKELFPWVPACFEQWFLQRGRRVVVDCDDAVWLRYQSLRRRPVRALLAGKHSQLFARADCVTAGNHWIGDFARAAGARDVRVLPSVVDLDRYVVRKGPRVEGPLRIGWIGSPATVHYLRVLGTVLQALAARQQFELVCVGGGMIPLPGVQVDSRPWAADTEAEEIRRFDIGIMPLTDGEWEQGKCGYKLIQYMACGVPVVGSRVGANLHIVTDGVDGLLAGGNAGWISALESLMTSPDLAARLGAAGRVTVEHSYSIQSRCAELAAALRGGD